MGFEFESNDHVDIVHDRNTAAGYRSHLAPCTPPWQSRFAILLDPDGHHVGLHGPRNLAADRIREKQIGNSDQTNTYYRFNYEKSP